MGESEFKKPDLQILIQDLASAQRTLFDERRYAERRLAEERRSHAEQTNLLFQKMNAEIGELKSQNDVLVRTLGRYQQENERLRVDLALVQAKKQEPAPKESEQKPADAPGTGIATKPLTVIPVPGPHLGSVPLTEKPAP